MTAHKPTRKREGEGEGEEKMEPQMRDVGNPYATLARGGEGFSLSLPSGESPHSLGVSERMSGLKSREGLLKLPGWQWPLHSGRGTSPSARPDLPC